MPPGKCNRYITTYTMIENRRVTNKDEESEDREEEEEGREKKRKWRKWDRA